MLANHAGVVTLASHPGRAARGKVSGWVREEYHRRRSASATIGHYTSFLAPARPVAVGVDVVVRIRGAPLGPNVVLAPNGVAEFVHVMPVSVCLAPVVYHEVGPSVARAGALFGADVADTARGIRAVRDYANDVSAILLLLPNYKRVGNRSGHHLIDVIPATAVCSKSLHELPRGRVTAYTQPSTTTNRDHSIRSHTTRGINNFVPYRLINRDQANVNKG